METISTAPCLICLTVDRCCWTDDWINDGTDPLSAESNYGAVHRGYLGPSHPRREKQNYRAAAALQRLLGAARPAGAQCNTSTGTYAVRYQRGGTSSWAVWWTPPPSLHTRCLRHMHAPRTRHQLLDLARTGYTCNIRCEGRLSKAGYLLNLRSCAQWPSAIHKPLPLNRVSDRHQTQRSCLIRWYLSTCCRRPIPVGRRG